MKNIIVENDSLARAGEIAARFVEPCAAVIVTDDNVNELYGDALEKSLVNAGYRPLRFVFPHGEASKNFATYAKLIEFLAENRLSRADAVFALGGGVVGDLAGFAAATYLRGVKLVQIPTTILACVDSSVGGKTAIDLPQGKNLCGAFYQPNCVIIDTSLTRSLPVEIFRDGMAEVIKYAAILDASLYDKIDDMPRTINEVVARCVELKSRIVEEDERDNGIRRVLNFGHTFGHAIETESNFSIGHGSAVAIGMAIMARACVKMSICDAGARDILLYALEKQGLPILCDVNFDAIARRIFNDKKRAGGRISLILLKDVGRVEIADVSMSEAEGFLRAGWET